MEKDFHDCINSTGFVEVHSGNNEIQAERLNHIYGLALAAPASGRSLGLNGSNCKSQSVGILFGN